MDAYSRVERGNAETCTCDGCRNFVVVRDRVFPADFVRLLDSLGIDPHKDGEVYRNGQVSSGRHDYGGWFHFVGTLDRTGNFPAVDFRDGFTAWMCHASAPALETLKGQALVQLEFHSTNVPWALAEPEPR